MRYCGSKRKFMKELLPILTKDINKETYFYDLFCGGANVVCDIPIENKVAVDLNKYVVALWKEIQENGMINIPIQVSEDMYNKVKLDYINHTYQYNDYIIGYVGTCCSFGGSWFNGYARYNEKKKEDHIKEAYNGLKKQYETFKYFNTTLFLHDSYDNIDLNSNSIVYCDIPYMSTKKYETDFNHEQFWKWARETSKKVKHLYVSEYDAPSDFVCVWKKEKKDSLGRKEGQKQNTKIEKLFVHKNCL